MIDGRFFATVHNMWMVIKKHWWPSSFHCTSFWMVTNVFCHHTPHVDSDRGPSVTIQILNQILKLMRITSVFLLTKKASWLWERILLYNISIACANKESRLFLKGLIKCRSCSLKLYHSITRFYFKTPSHLK